VCAPCACQVDLSPCAPSLAPLLVKLVAKGSPHAADAALQALQGLSARCSTSSSPRNSSSSSSSSSSLKSLVVAIAELLGAATTPWAERRQLLRALAVVLPGITANATEVPQACAAPAVAALVAAGSVESHPPTKAYTLASLGSW
jgi:hypothetical protein